MESGVVVHVRAWYLTGLPTDSILDHQRGACDLPPAEPPGCIYSLVTLVRPLIRSVLDANEFKWRRRRQPTQTYSFTAAAAAGVREVLPVAIVTHIAADSHQQQHCAGGQDSRDITSLVTTISSSSSSSSSLNYSARKAFCLLGRVLRYSEAVDTSYSSAVVWHEKCVSRNDCGASAVHEGNRRLNCLYTVGALATSCKVTELSLSRSTRLTGCVRRGHERHSS